MATCAVGGTITDSTTEAQIVSGGRVLTLTLTGDTWIAAAGDDWTGQQGSAVFFDGFEDGTHNAWDEENGTLDIAASPGYTGDGGSYVARSTVEETTAGFITDSFTGQAEVYVGVKVAVTTNQLNDAQYHATRILELYDSGETNFVYFILQASNADATIGTVGLGKDSASLTAGLYAALNMSATTWYQFKIHIKAGTGNAEIRIWYRTYGGSWTALGAGLTNSTFGNVTNIRVGRVGGEANARTGYIYIDDVQVSTTDVWGP